MLSFLLLFSTISTSTDNVYPTSMLIDESSEQHWTPHKIDRRKWTATADSQQTTDQVNEGPISNILTGDSTKIWLTKINNNGNGGHDDRTNKNGPFKFTINLNRRTTFKAFSLMPRQSGTEGKIKLYEFYAAKSENELNTKIQSGQYLAKGTIDPNEVKSTLVIFPYPITAFFVAVRSLDQETSASCAEFNLYSDPDSLESNTMQIYIDELRDKLWQKIDRTGWTASANSENSVNSNGDGPASNMLDGNTNTMWHSNYQSGHDYRPVNTDPFIATINLGKETTFKAFTYMPRQGGGTNGKFRHYEFYVANTQEELTTKIENNQYVAKGDMYSDDINIKLSTMVIFRTPLTGQFVALASLNHDSYATCVEFNLYSDSPDLPDFTSKEMVTETTDTTWNPYRIDRSGWSVSANSENSVNPNGDGPASNMIDGNTNTMWHSNYQSGHDYRPVNTDPFIATFDLGKETTFEAFSYMPRQGGGSNGVFKHFEFYAAQTLEDLNISINDTKYIAKGDINRSTSQSTFIIFEKPKTARYIALVSLNHDSYATCTEFNLYNGTPQFPIPTPPPPQTQLASKASINEGTDTFWTSYKVDRTGWKIRANSEERTVHSNGDGPVSSVLDGNPSSWWHTKYGTGHDDRNSNEPFHFSIDLGQETTFKAFAYRPRKSDDGGVNGKFKGYQFYTANTSEELFIKIQNRNFINQDSIDHDSTISTFVIFKELQTARHIAILVTEGVGGYASCAEFNLFTAPPPVESDQSVLTNQEGLINVTCDKFTYDNWPQNGICISSPSADHGSFTGTIGAKAKVTFYGVKAHILARKEGGSAVAYVHVDNQTVAILDLKSYSGGATNTIVYTSNDLDYGQHTIEIECLSTSSIVIGSVYIDPLPKENSYILGFSDFTQIDGQWTQDSSSTPPVFSSASDPASGTFQFYGTRFYLTGVRGNNDGNMKISVDDGDFATITEKKADGIAQNNKAIKLYDSGVLDFKMHTVKIQRTDTQISLMNFLYMWYPNTVTPAPTQSPSQSPSESATESATQSATESATESATQSATESATESATQSVTPATPTPATPTPATPTPATPTPATPTPATPTPATPTPATPTPATPTPTPYVNDIILTDDNFTESEPNRDRIEKEVPKEDNTNVAVVVKKSSFSGITNDNGGAIHLVNCGLKTDGTHFTKCQSNKGAGGAIFVENSQKRFNEVKLVNLVISECSAEYGGGAYIYSDSNDNVVDVYNCQFENNVATKSDSDAGMSGGSALFLTVKKSNVRKCKFANNDFKVYNDFSAKSLLLLAKSSLLITECEFTITKSMKYSIFYYGGNNAPGMQLASCSFYGKLNNDAYFIDGKLSNKNSAKMIVKKCKFLSNSRNALNQNGQFASIDLKDQIFEYEKFVESSDKKLNMKTIIIISASAFVVVVALIVSLVIIIKKRINPNVYSIAKDGIEMSSQSTDLSTNSLTAPLI